MKKFIIILLVFLTKFVIGQSNFQIGIQADHSQFNSKMFSGIGINIENKISNKFSLGYSYLIGTNHFGKTYMSSGSGQAAAFYGISNFRNENFDGFAVQILVLTMIIPESYIFYKNINENTRVSFVLSPYGFEYEKSYFNGDENWSISGEYAIRIHKLYSQNIEIVPQVGIKTLYKSSFREPAMTFGINIFYNKNF